LNRARRIWLSTTNDRESECIGQLAGVARHTEYAQRSASRPQWHGQQTADRPALQVGMKRGSPTRAEGRLINRSQQDGLTASEHCDRKPLIDALGVGGEQLPRAGGKLRVGVVQRGQLQVETIRVEQANSAGATHEFGDPLGSLLEHSIQILTSLSEGLRHLSQRLNARLGLLHAGEVLEVGECLGCQRTQRRERRCARRSIDSDRGQYGIAEIQLWWRRPIK
jgi:hypothetical protein